MKLNSPSCSRSEASQLQKKFLKATGLELTYDILATLPHIGFFVKNRESRYVAATPWVFLRLGCLDPLHIVGSSDHDHMLPELADECLEDDRRVVNEASELRNKLEVFAPHCCRTRLVITSKLPVSNKQGETVGLAGLIRHCRPGEEKDESKFDCLADSKVFKVLEYVRSHPERCPTAEELAVIAQCTKAELVSCFEDFFGCTPSYFIRSVRFRMVCRLLAQSSEPVSRLGETFGFRSPSAFSARFKELSGGLTPTQFRERCRTDYYAAETGK